MEVDVGTVAVLRRLAALSGATSALIAVRLGLGSSGAGVWAQTLRGLVAAVGVASALIALFLLWQAREASRHLDESPSYWRAQQRRFRPAIGRMLAVVAAGCLVAGGIAVWRAGWTLVGGFFGFAAICLGLVLAALFGGIRPSPDPSAGVSQGSSAP